MNDKVLCPHHKGLGPTCAGALQQAAIVMSVRSGVMDEDNLFQTLTREQIKRSSNPSLLERSTTTTTFKTEGTTLNNFGFGHNDKIRV